MPPLNVYIEISLDGYFSAPGGDIRWLHRPERDDEEWKAFVNNNASGGGTLIFGRVTHDMMVSFWPTPAASQAMPVIAEHINAVPKVVFSRTLKSSPWQNTRVVTRDLETEIRALKQTDTKGLTILGSGSIISQLTRANLIDTYSIIVNPLILGAGRTPFEGEFKPQGFKMRSSRAFQNGNVYITYERI